MGDMNLRISKVTTKKDLDIFVKFPWQVYKDNENWVPPLISDVKHKLSKKNPFWEHSEKDLFLLYDNNKLVGRIAGIIDHNYIDFQNEKAGFFGFYESFDNVEYAKALLLEVENWLKQKGMDLMYGPMNPSTNDEMGFLLEGFDSQPKIMMPYSEKFYLDLMEGAGLSKAKDLHAFIMQIQEAPLERLKKISDIAFKKYNKNKNIVIRPFDVKNFEDELKRALEIYNEAWDKNWGFVPWTEKEFVNEGKALKSLVFPGTTLFVEVDGEPAGMLIAVPDYNEVLKRINGRLNLTGIMKFLFYKNKIKGLRCMIIGVKQKFRKKGMESILLYESSKNAQQAGYIDCEFSWVLEDNIESNRLCEMMGGKIYKKYRAYKKNL